MARLLGIRCVACPLDANAFLSLRATGGSTVDDADFTNSPIASSLFKTVLLSTPSSLASSYTRAFGTQFLLSWAARIRARPLLIHGELVPSHRATMFVIPRLFPGHDGTYPHALDYRVQHTQARGLNAHGLTAAESVGYSAVSPLVEACASAIFLACARRIRCRSSIRSAWRPNVRSGLPCRWPATADHHE